ncbi:MAG: lytic murein transglycosylase B [SAR86 cluster bacterium]|uniref:Lytic murein transglycosylase B n=1 Tax=SAR86 cluster bacterium TaxID=2030880 RepID=A0A368BR65_9GAMM|nr:MAG: lytic murein transglycosylase B [SAR86 cluster bacterium]
MRIFLLLLMSSFHLSGYDFEHPKYELIQKALVEEHNFSAEEIKLIIGQAEKQQKIIDSMNSPAEFTWTWDRYRKLFIEPKRIKNGKLFIKKNLETLERAEAQFGVPKEVITAILGVETRYGKIMGSYRVLDALSTLSFDYPRRSNFFSQELINLLLLARENDLDIFKLKGSYAGAMGYGQFIPSSYRAYAVDFDNDGSVDLLNSVEDAIGSIGNYLYQHGWKSNYPIIWEVNNSFEGFNPDSVNNVRKKVNFDRKTMSPKNAIDFNFEELNTDVLLLSYETNKSTNYFVGTRNFIAITKYNVSHFYAKAVYDLAQEFL